MSEFFPKTEESYPLDDEHNVIVRRLTYGEVAAAKGISATRANGDWAAAQVFMRNELAVRAVVSWSGPMLDDVPCTAKNINALSLEIGDKIEDIAWAFNADDDGDSEKKESNAITK